MSDVDWNDMAEGWDDHGGVRAYAEGAYGSLVAVTERHGVSLTGRVLDVGCGTGLLTERLAPGARRVVALDPADAMVAVLREKARAAGWDHVTAITAPATERILAGDAFAEPFDLIVASSVCAFLDDYPGTVKLLGARLVPGGLFVQWDWELNPDDEEPYGLSRDAMGAALAGAGLEVLEVDVGFEAEFDGTTMRPLMGVGRRP